MFIIPGNPNANINYLMNDNEYKKSIVLHIKMNGSVFVVFSSKTYILMYTFNVLGIAENLIILNATEENVVSWKMYDKKMVKKEGVFNNNYLTVVGKSDKNPMTINNIFSQNFSALSLFESVELEVPFIYDKLLNDLDFWHQESRLTNIMTKYGIPFDVIHDCNGCVLWVYLGYHSCKSGKKIGFIILKTDEKNRIVSCYKHCNMCKSCSGSDFLQDYQSTIYN